MKQELKKSEAIKNIAGTTKNHQKDIFFLRKHMDNFATIKIQCLSWGIGICQ
jgi:hypothetical protein